VGHYLTRKPGDEMLHSICQEKTSPAPAIKNFFFDRQPSTVLVQTLNWADNR
jgi:hypothetical protein